MHPRYIRLRAQTREPLPKWVRLALVVYVIMAAVAIIIGCLL